MLVPFKSKGFPLVFWRSDDSKRKEILLLRVSCRVAMDACALQACSYWHCGIICIADDLGGFRWDVANEKPLAIWCRMQADPQCRRGLLIPFNACGCGSVRCGIEEFLAFFLMVACSGNIKFREFWNCGPFGAFLVRIRLKFERAPFSCVYFSIAPGPSAVFFVQFTADSSSISEYIAGRVFFPCSSFVCRSGQNSCDQKASGANCDCVANRFGAFDLGDKQRHYANQNSKKPENYIGCLQSKLLHLRPSSVVRTAADTIRGGLALSSGVVT